MTRPFSQLAEAEVDELAKLSRQERCLRILDEFDEWLAVRVLRLKLRSEDLPHLNDAFRDYFADTRMTRSKIVKESS